jgi:hypothetical protein
MSGLSDIVDEWAHQSVTIETPGIPDQYGNTSTGTATAYPAIVIQTNKLIRDREGNQVVSSCQVFLPSTVSVDPEAKITLPDGTQPVILNVATAPYFDGTNALTEVFT